MSSDTVKLYPGLRETDSTGNEIASVREKLWIGVAIATAGSANCVTASVPEVFADAALAAFDLRFPRPTDCGEN